MLNRRAFTGAALALAAGIALSACAPTEPQPPTIRAVVDSNASLSTLARLLANANVAELGGAGPWTVFAPRNSAFEALPEGEVDRLLLPENREELARVLGVHVVAGDYPASSLVNSTTTLTTASGLSIIVDGFNGVNVGGVEVVQPDVIASNGVLHIVDGIIVPPQ